MISLAPLLALASFQSAQGPERDLEQLLPPTIFLGSSVPPGSGCAPRRLTNYLDFSTNNMLLSLNAASTCGDARVHEESGATAQYFSFPHSTLSDLEHSLPT